MFKKVRFIVALMALGAGFQLFAVCSAGPISRSVCPPCPTNSAQFCNVCANTGRFEDLVVGNSLSLCPGVELPCFCCYNDEIQVNALGMQSSDIEQTITRFTVNSPTVLTGWNIAPSDEEPSTITAQFAVPFDFDPAVDPTLTIHFVVQNSPAQALLHRAPDSVNFEIGITFAGDGDNLVTLAPTVFTTGDLLVNSINSGIFHYQVNIPVGGVAITPGNFAYVTVTRIATEEDTEYSDNAALVELIYSYRKFAC